MEGDLHRFCDFEADEAETDDAEGMVAGVVGYVWYLIVSSQKLFVGERASGVRGGGHVVEDGDYVG